mgnify:FL=1
MATVSVNSLVSTDGAQLTGSATTLYTATGTKFQLTTIVLVNDTTTAVTATIYLVPSGGTAGVGNILVNAIAVPTDGSPLVLSFDELYLETSGTIQGLASTTDQVTYHISGKELNVA